MSPLPATYDRITLRQRPKGAINPTLDGTGTFQLEAGLNLNDVVKSLDNGELLVKVEWLSLDPAMRGWLNDSRSYIPPVKVGGEAMRAGGVGRVVAVGRGGSDKFTIGDWVYSTLGWQTFAKVTEKESVKLNIAPGIEPSYYLGALGMPAQTAFWGMLDVAKIQKGETVVVTGAAGAVGTVACQIAKIKGCRVIAVAGGKDKCDFLLKELGVDAALDYKSPTFVHDFKKTVGYLDVCFENVGGQILDLVLTRLKKGARIALCGAISAYNDPNPKGLQMYLNLISQRAKLEGFIVFDYAHRYPEAEAQLGQWIREGKMIVRETRLEGLESCPEGLCGLFRGDNTGKLVVRVGKEAAKL